MSRSVQAREFVAIRDAARDRGDRNLAAAMTVELARLGYIDPPERAAMETTEVARRETATVTTRRRGGRPRSRTR